MGIIPVSFLRFILVGVANTLVGLGVIWCVKELLWRGNVVSNISGYVVGVTVSFILNKRWTFSFRGDSGAALIRFLTVVIISYVANLLTVLALVRVSGRDSFWFQVCGAVAYSSLFYLGCRWYAFPQGRRKPRDARATAE